MKRIEKILLGIALALFIGTFVHGLVRGFLTLAVWLLALAYLGWGYHLLADERKGHRWLPILAGAALASSLVALPFAIHARQDLIFKLLPLPNVALFLFLLGLWVVKRVRGKTMARASKQILLRSSALLLIVGFLSYCPPNSIRRAVTIALNKGNEPLVQNMIMFGESEAFERAYANNDCANALVHAQRANHAGLFWLTNNGAFLPGSGANAQEQLNALAGLGEGQLSAIGKTFQNLYIAYRCLARQAEQAKDPQAAYNLYAKGDSVLNVKADRTRQAREDRAWSMNDVARCASQIGKWALADTLFSRSVEEYRKAKDTLDADATPLIAEWAYALAREGYWKGSNQLLLHASAILAKDSSGTDHRESRLRFLGQVVKNRFNSDDLLPVPAELEKCTALANPNSSEYCVVLYMRGTLAYLTDRLVEADTAFTMALQCLGEHRPPNDNQFAIVHLSLGYARAALAQFKDANDQVDQGLKVLEHNNGRYSTEAGPYIQLRATISRAVGNYNDAENEYDQAISLLSQGGNPIGSQIASALSNSAYVAFDLAHINLGKQRADSALRMVVENMNDLLPSQTFLSNASAYGDYLLGNYGNATNAYKTTLNINAKYGRQGGSTDAEALNGLGLINLATGQYAAADTLFGQALALFGKILPQSHPYIGRAMLNQALLRIKQKRYDEARLLLGKAMDITISSLSADHDQAGDIHVALADIDQRTGHPAQAQEHYRSALAIYRIRFPATHPKVLSVQRMLR